MLGRFLFALCLAAAAAAHAGEKPLPPFGTEEIPSPAATGVSGASLFSAADGTVWLTWIELGDGPATLRCSTLDAGTTTWRAPQTIAAGASVHVSAMDFPQLAADARGRATVVWTDGRGGARLSRTTDRGATWSAPAPVTRESDAVEKFTLTILADDRVLVAWLDARAKKSGGQTTALYARVLDEPAPDTLVDPSVCDCCQTTLTPFLDGGALLAYRGRTTDEVRDIRTARFRGKSWDEPRPLGRDDWRIAACPMNGPRLASDGGRVAAVWFTAADNDPRVLASFSPDAGTRFLMPLRVDHGHAAGRVETLLLRDGAMLVTWLEADGSYWLRRLTPEFSADEPFALAPAGAVPVKNFPRAALVRNYAGGDGTAQFVTAFVGSGKDAPLKTLLVTVPEGALIAAAKNCDCAPTPEQLAGFPLRGTFESLSPAEGTLRVAHGEIPGIFAPGAHVFRGAPATLAAVTAGRQFLGRIERRHGAWWLYDVRLLAAPPETK
jgi:hypothetical protein